VERDLLLLGVPGPTFVHAGLSPGNRAAERHAGHHADPRAAARAVIGLARALLGFGQTVGILPPLARPDLGFLRRCGYPGDSQEVLRRVAAEEPWLLAAAMGTSYGWTANAATVAGAGDTSDGTIRLLPANLVAMTHRALETLPRAKQLAQLLPQPAFRVLEPLPADGNLGDEGAANHSRVVGSTGVCHVFVHGRQRGDAPLRRPARQTLEASRAAARLLGLHPERVLHVRQRGEAIEAGAFHNDVVMVGAGDRILIHARAWEDQRIALEALRQRCGTLRIREVTDEELGLHEAVATYLFNSQLLPQAAGWTLVAPEECAVGAASQVIEALLAEGFIHAVQFVSLRDSMHGGGGPACLRLRVPVTAAALGAVHPALRLTTAHCDTLEAWVDRWYPTQLSPDDLADPALLEGTSEGLLRLHELLGIRSLS
jgi:succinylarginine dihydrolase